MWVDLLKHFNYMKVIFIHSSDTDGRALLGRFQTTSQNLEADVEIKVQASRALNFRDYDLGVRFECPLRTTLWDHLLRCQAD